MLRSIWAGGLALAAVLVGLFRSRPQLAILLAVLISTAVCVAGTRALIHLVPLPEAAAASHDRQSVQLDTPGQAALVTWSGTDRFTLMKTLFWTPTIDRVLVIGGGSAERWLPIGSRYVQLFWRSRRSRQGSRLGGPFAFAPDTTVVAGLTQPMAGLSQTAWLTTSPRAMHLRARPHRRPPGHGSRVVRGPEFEARRRSD